MGKAEKLVMIDRIRGLPFWRAYRFCRRAGEYPWCSLRMAICSRGGV